MLQYSIQIQIKPIKYSICHCHLQSSKKTRTFRAKFKMYWAIYVHHYSSNIRLQKNKFSYKSTSKRKVEPCYIYLSLAYNFDHLCTIFTEININFDAIWITESSLKKERTKTTHIDITGYTLEHTHWSILWQETSLKDTLKYICRKDLQIHKAGKLESAFIELLSSFEKKI